MPTGRYSRPALDVSMTIFALETSCDETGAAVIRDGRIVANLVSSQVRLHAEYGGVVPELATREHLRNLRPLALLALRTAGVGDGEFDAVAATRGPGLPNALLIGFQVAQALAFAARKPFYGIHHHEAHLYSAWIHGDPPGVDWAAFEPSVALIASGGHTLLVHVEPGFRHRVLGGTLDDAAGECFDKVAKLLGLPYPGGPALERMAAEGQPNAFAFPRPMIHEPNDQFSFSGLKTSVRYFLQKNPRLLEDRVQVCHVCASVQAAIVDVLVAKTVRAARRLGVKGVTASGGVVCNRTLRCGLDRACRQAGLRLQLASPEFCTDNAAMVGIVADRKIREQWPPTPLDAEIQPGWILAQGGIERSMTST
jgi:N6-L-threonylcarbamoyladenine synthase